MTIRSLLRMGNPQLCDVAQPVKEFNTPELIKLVDDMFTTMQEYGGVGIAAPQIGISLQITVFGFDVSKRYPQAKAVPKTVLINPTITLLTDEKYEDWEGCLSVKIIRGLVPRYKKIRYSGYDLAGNFFERDVEGFHARLVQHEYDHLQGKLFYFRVEDFRHFGFEDEIGEVMKQVGKKIP